MKRISRIFSIIMIIGLIAGTLILGGCTSENPNAPAPTTKTETDITAVEEALAETQADLTALEQKVINIDAPVGLKDKLNNIEASLSTLANELDNIGNFEQTNQAIINLKNDVATANDHIAALGSDINRIDGSYQTLYNELNTIQANLNALENAFDNFEATDVDDLYSKVTALDATITTMQSTLTSIRNAVADYDWYISELHNRLGNLQTEVNNINLETVRVDAITSNYFTFTPLKRGEYLILLTVYSTDADALVINLDSRLEKVFEYTYGTGSSQKVIALAYNSDPDTAIESWVAGKQFLNTYNGNISAIKIETAIR